MNNIIANFRVSLELYLEKHPNSIDKLATTCTNECFTNYLGVASKCFDCEKQYPDDQKWKAQPSKCFDCERELSEKYGKNSVRIASEGIEQKWLMKRNKCSSNFTTNLKDLLKVKC